MRDWRKTHPLNKEQQRKEHCRAHTRMMIRRGTLTREPCIICGTEPAQAHHPDYDQPRLVIWLCPSHHRQHHKYLLDYIISKDATGRYAIRLLEGS